MSDEVTVNREQRDSEVRAPGPGVDVRGDRPGLRPASKGEIPTPDQERLPLFAGEQAQHLRTRWENLQVGFVDEPKRSVEEADRLVTEAINSLSDGFASQRRTLEQQWHREGDVSTEDLRLALRRYRSFFERLLSL